MQMLRFAAAFPVALAVVACGMPAASDHSSEASNLESGGDEWARCWLTERVQPDPFAGHHDVTCRAATGTMPAFTNVVVTIEGHSAAIGTEPVRVTTVRGATAATFSFSPSADPNGLGLHQLTRVVDLTGSTEAAPAIVRSPFATWTVTIESSSLFILSLDPYAVSLGSFTTSVPRNVQPPPQSEGYLPRVTTTLLAPASGRLDGFLHFGSGPRTAITLTGSGHFTATPEGLRPFVEGGGEITPTPTDCGEPGQRRCCDTAGQCACNAYRVPNISGTCNACGDVNERACPGRVCRPGLTRDEASGLCAAP